MIREKIKQLFCKHKEIEYKKKIQPFHNIQGETVYMFCKDCGKLLGTKFMSNEEFYASFKIEGD